MPAFGFDYPWVRERTRILRDLLLGCGGPLEVDGGQWGKGEAEGEGAALAGVVGGVLAALVADIGTAIVGCVGVENFLVKAGAGNADDIAFADDGSSIDDDDDHFVVSFVLAQH